VSLAVVLGLVAAGPVDGGVDRTGAEKWWLSSEQIASMEKLAVNGDGAAAMRLFHHYAHFGEPGEDGRWLRRAMELKEVVAMWNFAVGVEVDQAANLEDLSEAECWLSVAIDIRASSGRRESPTAGELRLLRARLVARKPTFR